LHVPWEGKNKSFLGLLRLGFIIVILFLAFDLTFFPILCAVSITLTDDTCKSMPELLLKISNQSVADHLMINTGLVPVAFY